MLALEGRKVPEIVAVTPSCVYVRLMFVTSIAEPLAATENNPLRKPRRTTIKNT